MKCNFKKIGILALVLTLLMSLAACSFGKKTNDSQNAKKIEAHKIKTDTAMTAQLKKEKPILNGQVYVQDNRAIATMVIKDGFSNEQAKELAQRYAKILKKKHKDMQVNVMAVRDNKNIVNLTVK